MKIQIILGSTSDMPIAEKAKKILNQFTVDYDIKVASAHRTPDVVKISLKKMTQTYSLVSQDLQQHYLDQWQLIPSNQSLEFRSVEK